MPGLVPGIDDLRATSKTWMAGSSPAMTIWLHARHSKALDAAARYSVMLATAGPPCERSPALTPELHQKLTAWRRHLHAHPELSLQEKETAAFVQGKLTEL